MIQPQLSAPVFHLYGENHSWPTPDLIHCESISSRSQLHDWKIKPHRHSDLVQLLFLRAGRADAELDGSAHLLQPATLLLVPAMCIHGFQFSRDVSGEVISLATPLVGQLATRQPLLRPLLREVALFPLENLRQRFETLIGEIAAEYARPAPGRELVLESLAGILLTWIARLNTEPAATGGQPADRGGQHLLRFSRLVEREYRAHRPIDFYAERIGITPAHLNALCRRLSGRSALQIIHERLLLEAKRALIYTAMTINQVSDSLGFSEPAYFTRFFKRLTGLSPRVFRGQQLQTEQREND
ncbi:helix-turn-helix domain-containing protein [Microbulbifer taiwanensis]|uniref:Helix-turn-helix domain-containing protein n=1 Tax=Microbulbifer taiwanensis TaxID=986746 RepID=A0ABW1YIM8_9GAMM|nr:helix-turn-helix domain-containing protein [Microbulbifer taiwanensis]